MRTVRCSGHLGGGGVPIGVSAWGGVHLPHCGQTDTCENITFPQLLLRTVMKEKPGQGWLFAKANLKLSDITQLLSHEKILEKMLERKPKPKVKRGKLE